MRVGKGEFVRQMRDKYRYSLRDASEFIDDFFTLLADNLAKGNVIVFPGYFKFYNKTVKGREFPHPITGEILKTKTHNVPKVKAGSHIKLASERSTKILEERGEIPE